MTSPLKTKIEVEIYEKNDKEIPPGKSEFITVKSHWNHGDCIILSINNLDVTVIASELIEAIKRASY